jgi:hypothetical protein
MPASRVIGLFFSLWAAATFGVGLTGGGWAFLASLLASFLGFATGVVVEKNYRRVG